VIKDREKPEFEIGLHEFDERFKTILPELERFEFSHKRQI